MYFFSIFEVSFVSSFIVLNPEQEFSCFSFDASLFYVLFLCFSWFSVLIAERRTSLKVEPPAADADGGNRKPPSLRIC